MDIIIYTKKGNKSWQEKKWIKELAPIFEEELKKNPSLASSFKPANTKEELERMYYQYTSQETPFTEVSGKSDMKEPEVQPEQPKQPEPKPMQPQNDALQNYDKDEDFIPETNPSPLTDQEPITYDYTLSGSGGLEENPVENTGQTNFNEPTSYEEAFTYPTDDEPSASGSGGGNSGGNGGGGNTNNDRASRPSNDEPRFNPDFDDMSSAKKRKSTKKFAKYIVETICMLQEKGFVWYANKDINEAKLAEYELKDEIDLSLLLTLEGGQEATVKQFFQMQARKAEELAVIDDESKQDLIDSLFEVLMEKGIAPTPAQELMLVAGKIIVGQAISLLSISAQTNSVLAQLRLMKKQENETEDQPLQEEPSYFDRQAPQSQAQPSQQQATPQPAPIDPIEVLLSDETGLITTKE